MNLSEAIGLEFVGVNERIGSKADALRRIAELAKKSTVLADVKLETIYDELHSREQIGSTGFGHGIAIPHCRLAGITDFVVGLVTVEKGVRFDAVDGKPVRIIAFIVGPESETTRHLKLLSSLSLALSSEPVRAAILAAITPESLVQAVDQGSTGGVVSEQQGERRLFQIVVQDESIFEQLLEVFEGMDGASVTVIESKSSGFYLARLPLFASLLSDASGGFNRIIVATIGRTISNEAVRRIETVTGPLDNRNDILVVVQEIHYSAGALSV
ncbi:MAG: PTS sugar transporter subunit IIA [Spirochaetia bacterium]